MKAKQLKQRLDDLLRIGTCTESSNLPRSATQSRTQRNLAAIPTKSLEMAAISRMVPANRTGESVLLYSAGKLCRTFLRRAHSQSGFKDSLRRMQCDHKPMILRRSS